MTSKTLLTTLAALTSLGLAASALAASPDPDTVSVKVSIGDLNLASQVGAAVALQRIHNAATSICGPAPYGPDLQRTGDYQACMDAVVDHAVSTLGAPLVTALRANHGQRPTVQTASR